MKRLGNVVWAWMLITAFAINVLHVASWAVLIAAFAVGWYYNEQEAKRDA